MSTRTTADGKNPVTHIQSATVPIDRLLPGIHGLRGIAALAVVLFHIVHVAKISTPETFGFIARDFGKGVQLFFVISASSLMYSAERSLCVWQSTRPSRWVANRILEYLGERSYSVYLLHPIVIVLLKNPIQNLYTALTPYFGTYAYFICVLATLGPLLLLAETTYQLIEVPGIAIGKKVNSRARDRESTLSEDSQDRSGEARKHLL